MWTQVILLGVGAVIATGVSLVYELWKGRRDDKAARATTVALLRWFAEDLKQHGQNGQEVVGPWATATDENIAQSLRDAYHPMPDYSPVILKRVEHVLPAELISFRSAVFHARMVEHVHRQLERRCKEWRDSELTGETLRDSVAGCVVALKCLENTARLLLDTLPPEVPRAPKGKSAA